MDKILEGVSKIFSHLARDIQAYILAGLVLLLNFYILDTTYHSGRFSEVILEIEYPFWIVLVLAYILGQISLGFYSCLLELTRWDIKFLYKRVFKKRFEKKDKEGNIIVCDPATEEKMIRGKWQLYKTDKDIYIHFVERQVILAVMRWNLSAVFLIASLLDLGYCLIVRCDKTIIGAAIVFFVLSLLLMILHIQTQRENDDQLEKVTDLFKDEPDVKTMIEATVKATEAAKIAAEAVGKAAEALKAAADKLPK